MLKIQGRKYLYSLRTGKIVQIRSHFIPKTLIQRRQCEELISVNIVKSFVLWRIQFEEL